MDALHSMETALRRNLFAVVSLHNMPISIVHISGGAASVQEGAPIKDGAGSAVHCAERTEPQMIDAEAATACQLSLGGVRSSMRWSPSISRRMK